MQERPHGAPVGLDAACCQFRRQTAGGERPLGDARAQPIRTLGHQGPRLVPARLPWRQRPGLAQALAPLRHAGRADLQRLGNRADRLASLGTLHGTFSKIFRIWAHLCWPPPSAVLESQDAPFRDFRFLGENSTL